MRASSFCSRPAGIPSPDELEIFFRLRESKDVDVAAPCVSCDSSMVLVMKATRLCNLRCTYCHSWKAGPNQVMGFEVLAKTTRDALQRPEVRRVNFVWHGGEVTLLPIGFFKKALWLQRMFKREGQVITNSIQTNATRLNDEWISLFASTSFDVGVSIDGPREIHDRRRRTVSGRPTWNHVRAGIAQMQQANVPCAVLVVVDREVVELGAERLLHSLLELKVAAAALLNVLPPNGEAQPTGNSYLPWSDYRHLSAGDVSMLVADTPPRDQHHGLEHSDKQSVWPCAESVRVRGRLYGPISDH